MRMSTVELIVLLMLILLLTSK